MGFKENLRFRMDSLGIQTKELSSKTGISENTLKTYLKENSAEPTVSKAAKIAKALNISLDQLVNENENSTVNLEAELIKSSFIKLSEKEKHYIHILIREMLV